MIDTTTTWPERPSGAYAPRVLYVLERGRVWGTATTLFVLAHAPLVWLLQRYPLLGHAYPLAVAAVGGWWLLRSERIERMAYFGAYVVGAEVLWRILGVNPFWEYGKYLVIGVFLVAALFRKQRRPSWLALGFFLLLVPSVALTIGHPETSMSEARRMISFNLSGPLALAVCAWFFRDLALTKEHIVKTVAAMIAPVIGVAAMTAMATYGGPAIAFGMQSNFLTSAGFGPNQVSSILSLGALAVFIVFLVEGFRGIGLRLFLFALALVFLVQSAMTFSRGGVYMVLVSVAVSLWFAVRTREARLRVALLLGGIALVMVFAVLPLLESFTQGMLLRRFQDTRLSGRIEILARDIEVWYENLTFGVGPGMASETVSASGMAVHTEYSRILAEHGLFGLVALALLGFLALSNFLRHEQLLARAIVVALLTWSFAFMAINGTRLLAPMFVLALTCAWFLPDRRLLSPPTSGPRRSS